MPKGKTARTPENLALATELRAQGLVYREIADRLGVSTSTVAEWFTDPDRSKHAVRRARYAGECVDCGRPTDGSRGPGSAPERCMECLHEFEYGERNRTMVEMWQQGYSCALIGERVGLTDKKVATAVQCWRDQGVDLQRRTLPSRADVVAERDAEIVRLWHEGLTPAQIADRLGFANGPSLMVAVARLRRRGADLPYRRQRRDAAFPDQIRRAA